MTNAGCLAGVFSESGGTHRRLQRWWQYWQGWIVGTQVFSLRRFFLPDSWLMESLLPPLFHYLILSLNNESFSSTRMKGIKSMGKTDETDDSVSFWSRSKRFSLLRKKEETKYASGRWNRDKKEPVGMASVWRLRSVGREWNVHGRGHEVLWGSCKPGQGTLRFMGIHERILCYRNKEII